MANYETLKQAGYKHLKSFGNGFHILLNEVTNKKEVFACSKNFAGWALIYKNTHLEFVAGYIET